MALEFEHDNLEFLLRLIDLDHLEDVAPGINVEADLLKELHDVRLPEIKAAIRDCRDAAGRYSARRGCDAALIRRSLTACGIAHEWTRQVLARYREDQFHLSGNTPVRDTPFTVYDPHGEVSVYEFFMRFEEYSKGYLNSEAKAQLLFSKYLPKSLTESYQELKDRKRDYDAMRDWLIDQYGMIKRVCDTKIKLIKSFKHPKGEDDLVGETLYYRKVHQAITSLRDLEIRKGVRVPGLIEHMETNTFLMQLTEVLPKCIQLKWGKMLVREGITTWKVEGRVYLDRLLAIIQRMYFTCEAVARIPGNDHAPKGRGKANHAATDGDGSPTPPPAPQPAANASNTPNPGAQQDSRGRGNNNGNQGGSKQGRNPGSPTRKPSRWTCLIKGHEGHKLWECQEFFRLTAKERRTKCALQGCWTCLARRNDKGDCKKGECSRLKEIPVLLLCQGCLVAGPNGRPALNIFLCAMDKHDKPSPELLGEALEKWVPNFKVTGLSSPIVIGLSTVLATPRGKPPASKTSPPTSRIPMQTFDTRDGSVRQIEPRDTIIMPSKEEPFFIMQQLRIGGEDVLTFYDTGANVHLVEGALAERVGFTVLDDKCVSIGVIGGGQVWTEYGQYACVLGPDANRQYHQIECQGLERISSYVPEVDLRPLAKLAAPTLLYGDKMNYPKQVGGDRVKLLIGIRSTALGPRLHCSLPNGLGVFISALLDIHGSKICFGGTHEVFTQGFAKAGMSAGHVQVLLTQIASAYMRTPYTMVRASCDDHGPTEGGEIVPLNEDQWSKHTPVALCEHGGSSPALSATAGCHCVGLGLSDYGSHSPEGTILLPHIEGTENLADMITKPHRLPLADLSSTSEWMTGTEVDDSPHGLSPSVPVRCSRGLWGGTTGGSGDSP
jgi:hypothetical protein